VEVIFEILFHIRAVLATAAVPSLLSGDGHHLLRNWLSGDGHHLLRKLLSGDGHHLLRKLLSGDGHHLLRKLLKLSYCFLFECD
jgi:hypothetical protein